MRNLYIYLTALASLHDSVALRHGSSQFQDLQAFPKFEIQFLNHLPIAESDASKCESAGLEMEDEWMGLHAPVGQRRIGSDVVETNTRLDLVRMALAPPGAAIAQPYLCLMPHPNSTASQIQPENPEPDDLIDPAQSWAALSHLEGQCLYTQIGWFTYSYCHNSHIRQFRAAKHEHPHPPGGYTPVEDPEYDAYTLGQAHASPRRARGALPAAGRRKGQGQQPESAELESRKRPSDLEAGTGAGSGGSAGSGTTTPASPASLTSASTLGTSSRYLIQRWSDGTRCDKTGRPRETEIQIHCSMTSSDRIYLIKELAVCQYVIIIHSPHLCSLPGFRAKQADVQPAAIRCRQVLPDDEFESWVSSRDRQDVGVLPSLRPGILQGLDAPPDLAEQAQGQGTQKGAHEREQQTLKDLLLLALQQKAEGGTGGVVEVDFGQHRDLFDSLTDGEEDGDGDVLYVSLQDDGPMVVEAGGLDGRVAKDVNEEERRRIMSAVKDFLGQKSKKDRAVGQEEDEEQEGGRERDEL